MIPRILTIGVYGFTENHFFNSIVKAHVDTFCDIRARRGMRGSQYSFVNSNYLQNKLKELGIKYYHLKYLAPSEKIRTIQRTRDAEENTLKRKRQLLDDQFIDAYQKENLADFSPSIFFSYFETFPQTFVLFCVERDPLACHRSIIANKLAEQLSTSVEDILP